MPIRPPRITIDDITAFKEQTLEGRITIRKNGVVVRNPSSKEFWKSFERRVAKDFKTTRTPLSGMVKTITNSDTLHPKIYIECKARGGDKMKYIDTFRELRTGNRIEYYEIINNKLEEKIWLFDSQDFLKLMNSHIFNLNLVNCVAVSKVYKSVLSLFRQTIYRAEIEDKLPVIALKKKNTVGYLIGTHPKYLEKLFNILNNNNGRKKRKGSIR